MHDQLTGFCRVKRTIFATHFIMVNKGLNIPNPISFENMVTIAAITAGGAT